jgi:hypothetical protein
MGWVVNATPRQRYIQYGDPVPIVLEAGWAPGPAGGGGRGKGRRNISPHRDSIPGPSSRLIPCREMYATGEYSVLVEYRV